MRKAALWGLIGGFLVAGGVFIYEFAFAGGAAIACPAQVALDPDRPDCPGRVVCPLTGELVCRDRCPLGPGAGQSEDTIPSCCHAGNK